MRPNEGLAADRGPARATGVMNATRRFTTLSADERRSLREAVLALSQVGLALRIAPFQRLARGLDHHPEAPDLPELDDAQWARAKRTAWAIRAAGRRLPLPRTCLAQAFAAQRLCPDIPGAIVLGVNRHQDSNDPSLAAHAWWRCGDQVLLGEEGHGRFTPISALTWGFDAGA